MLYFIANSDGGEDFAALGFISLALGYALTAMFSTNHRIRSWIALPEISEKSTASRVKRFFFKFQNLHISTVHFSRIRRLHYCDVQPRFRN